MAPIQTMDNREKIQQFLATHGAEFTSAEISEAVEFLHDLPTQINVAKVPLEVFHNQAAKDEFEELFRSFDDDVVFYYLPSFRRVRVVMTNSEAALLARLQTQGWKLSKSRTESDETEGLRCFFAQFSVKKEIGDPDPNEADNIPADVPQSEQDEGYLKLPKPNKLFLLSPPASPPVGWEPRVEAEPILNYELISALANLDPCSTHELHPSSNESSHPAIVLTTCEESNFSGSKLAIAHTRCPDRI